MILAVKVQRLRPIQIHSGLAPTLQSGHSHATAEWLACNPHVWVIPFDDVARGHTALD